MAATGSDAELARMLQLQFDSEAAREIKSNDVHEIDLGGPSQKNGRRRSGPMGIVDERWDLIDPHPDIRALFMQFNDQFFWGRLEGIEVRWSPRMTLCAGLCCYEGFGGLCSVRLSQPLLKLRPRKDCVETLLHEMIHAYLFVTQNNKDHDGHGPEFCKHMNRINGETGTNISIYHTFHDEVDLYRQHWWRCDGPCRQRKPYFGYVKRAMNRAPSSKDFWWGEHQQSCGGTYTKVKEPEGYGEKKGGKKKQKQEDETGGSKGSPDNTDKPSKHGADIRNFIPFSGKGQALAGSSSSSASSSSSSSSSSSANFKTSSSGSAGGKTGSHANRKNSSDDKDSKSDISSFFVKKPSGTSSQGNPATNSSGSHTVSRSGTTSAVLKKGGSDGDVSHKRPGFTPVVATASGRLVTDSKDPSLSSRSFSKNRQPNVHTDSDSDSQRTSRKCIPVVAAVGRKGSSPSVERGDMSASARLDTKTKIASDNSMSRRSNSTGGDRTRKEWTAVDLTRSDSPSSERSRNKRARLLDLQAMFDSDSDEEKMEVRPAKCPRYNIDDDDDGGDVSIVEDGHIRRISAGSNKENTRNDVFQHPSGNILVTDDSDDEPMVNRNTTSITSGIWKDLSHLSSTATASNDQGNRRFGRVPPPLWGKSKGKRGSQTNTPPRSSFSEHPWQTAARASGKKTSSSVARVTETDGVINLTLDDEDAGTGVGFVEDGQAGPKTVQCPVCTLQIEEKKINRHLDTCLTYNCDSLFSR